MKLYLSLFNNKSHCSITRVEKTYYNLPFNQIRDGSTNYILFLYGDEEPAVDFNIDNLTEKVYCLKYKLGDNIIIKPALIRMDYGGEEYEENILDIDVNGYANSMPVDYKYKRYIHCYLKSLIRGKEKWLSKALNIRNSMAMNYKMLNHYRINNKIEKFSTYYDKLLSALDINFNNVDIIMFENFKYLCLEEISICSYYLGKLREGSIACELILRNRNIPHHRYTNTMTNSRFYIPFLNTSRCIILPKLCAKFLPCNPSILKTEYGFLINIRHVNYILGENQKYQLYDGTIKTRNFLCKFDDNYNFMGANEIEDDLNNYNFYIKGLEDLRLYQYDKNTVRASCTSLEFNNRPRIYDLDIIWTGTKYTYSKEHLSIMFDKQMNRQEKNWLFITPDKILYSLEPFIIIDKQGTILYNNQLDVSLSDLRNGAITHLGDDNYLMVAHHHFNETFGRKYLNKLIWLKIPENLEGIKVLAITPSFTIFDSNVEFISGIVVKNNKIILTVGVEDREAFLLEIDRLNIPVIKTIYGNDLTSLKE